MLTAQRRMPPTRTISRCATAQRPITSTAAETRSRPSPTVNAAAVGCGINSSAAGMKNSEMAKIAVMPTTE